MNVMTFLVPIVKVSSQRGADIRANWTAWTNDRPIIGSGETEAEAIKGALCLAAKRDGELSADDEPTMLRTIGVTVAIILAGVAVAVLIILAILGLSLSAIF